MSQAQQIANFDISVLAFFSDSNEKTKGRRGPSLTQ